MDYPKWVYNAAGQGKIVNSAEEQAALGPGWSETAPLSADPDIGPKFLPTTQGEGCVTNLTCRVTEIQITNASGQTADIFVYDRQSPAVPVVVSLATGPGEMVSMSSQKGRLMIGGITWWASQSGVSGWMCITYQ